MTDIKKLDAFSNINTQPNNHNNKVTNNNQHKVSSLGLFDSTLTNSDTKPKTVDIINITSIVDNIKLVTEINTQLDHIEQKLSNCNDNHQLQEIKENLLTLESPIYIELDNSTLKEKYINLLTVVNHLDPNQILGNSMATTFEKVVYSI